MSEQEQGQKNRLFWASRRGMLELDLVLLPFAENVYPTLPQDDQNRYWKLLDQEDQDLFAWFLRRGDPEDPDLLRIVEIVRANTGLQV
ncbi:FAD assembly factor SdhE [Gilvimarinus sp. F26214L]|uniref:FAD assembly factor SdhE n=1 Tax=Gilvimarinus sp. DZF01 TaxID=3461371 RepID=UPI004045AC90